MNKGDARKPTTDWLSPLFLGRMEDQEQDDTNKVEEDKEIDLEEQEEVNTKTLKSIEELRQAIFKFKYDLYKEIVINDKVHSANTMEAMRVFHALFLQTIAHLISLLDSTEVPPPSSFSSTIQPKFKSIQQTLARLIKSNRISYALVYNMLFQFSTQHPFDLGVREPVAENSF